VAWETLCCLDRTRTARALADRLHDEPDAADLAAAVDEAVEVIDKALADVLFHLRGCLMLTQAWEAKLRHADLHTRTDAALDSLRESQATRVAAAAEPLPQNVFAYVTAARDVTDTGPFPWERANTNTTGRAASDGDTP
jgi:hypothetical protein